MSNYCHYLCAFFTLQQVLLAKLRLAMDSSQDKSYNALCASGCNHSKSTKMEINCYSLNFQPNLSSNFGNT